MKHYFVALTLAFAGCPNNPADPPDAGIAPDANSAPDALVDGADDADVADDAGYADSEPDSGPETDAGNTCARGPENTAERCSDGCDNDGDGLVDDAEASCAVCEEIQAVDLLVVVDNSFSMQDEQESLRSEALAIIQALTSGVLGDRTIDPIADLHVGVITTDMGIGGVDDLCENADFGDDGVLQVSDCEEGPAPFLTLQAGERGSEDLAQALECQIGVGTGGCGFEQPLEAMLKALTPGTSGIRFSEGTSGHGDGANAGFLRDDALLIVVVLTDEDDCSASNPAIFRRDNSSLAPELNDPRINARCSEILYGNRPGILHPVQRFAEGLIDLKGPERVLFVPIVGIPTDLARDPGDTIEWERYVGEEGVRDPRLVEGLQLDTPGSDPTLLVPSCHRGAMGQGMPPTRILRTARALEEAGAQVSLMSICEEDYSSVARSLFEGTANLPQVCTSPQAF